MENIGTIPIRIVSNDSYYLIVLHEYHEGAKRSSAESKRMEKQQIETAPT
ncbi:hypothetical protein ACUL41_13520 [Virgibacillus natechei]